MKSSVARPRCLSRRTTIARRRRATGRRVRSATSSPLASSLATVRRDRQTRPAPAAASRFGQSAGADRRRPRRCQRVPRRGHHHQLVADPANHAQVGMRLRALDEADIGLQPGHRLEHLAGVADRQVHRAVRVRQLPLRHQAGQQVFADRQAGGHAQGRGVLSGEQRLQLGRPVHRRRHRAAVRGRSRSAPGAGRRGRTAARRERFPGRPAPHSRVNGSVPPCRLQRASSRSPRWPRTPRSGAAKGAGAARVETRSGARSGVRSGVRFTGPIADLFFWSI